jgi:hypothetical protein
VHAIRNFTDLLGVEEHLQFDHQRLALFTHLADLRIAIIQCGFVSALIVFELIVELLHLLFKQCVLQFSGCR